MCCWEIFKMHNKKIYLSLTVPSSSYKTGKRNIWIFDHQHRGSRVEGSEFRAVESIRHREKQQIFRVFLSFPFPSSLHLALIYLAQDISMSCSHDPSCVLYRVPKAVSTEHRSTFYVINCDGLGGERVFFFSLVVVVTFMDFIHAFYTTSIHAHNQKLSVAQVLSHRFFLFSFVYVRRKL